MVSLYNPLLIVNQNKYGKFALGEHKVADLPLEYDSQIENGVMIKQYGEIEPAILMTQSKDSEKPSVFDMFKKENSKFKL